MKISHGKLEGYIFSGFGLIGEWLVPATTINNDYRILRVGRYCEAINYDPKLNWYALTKDNGTLSVKKSDVTLRLIHEFNEQDTLEEEKEYWTQYPLIVQSNLKDTILFLIGTKTKFEEGSILSPFLANYWGNSEYENFLFPEQTHEYYYEGISYQFHAFEGVKLTKDHSDGYIKTYQIELKIIEHPKTNKYNLSNELGLESPAERHCFYKTPKLILIGDINKDGLPDFIYFSHSMSDHCGGCWEYHLFLSDKPNPDKPIRKVANQISCNCI